MKYGPYIGSLFSEYVVICNPCTSCNNVFITLRLVTMHGHPAKPQLVLCAIFAMVCFKIVRSNTENALHTENFDSLNTTTWKVENNDTEMISDAFVSNTLSFLLYSSSNVDVSNGILSIGFTRDINDDYTSGKLSSCGFMFKYGYVEARAKVPAEGLHASFFLFDGQDGCVFGSRQQRVTVFGAASHNETAMEARYYVDSSTTGSPVSDLLNEQKIRKVHRNQINMSLDWHIYGLLWTPNSLQWFIDGNPTFYINGKNLPRAISAVPMFVDIRIGGGSSSFLPQTFLVDYVLVRPTDGRYTTHDNITESNQPLPLYISLGIIFGVLSLTAGMASFCIRRRRLLKSGTMRKKAEHEETQISTHCSMPVKAEIQAFIDLLQIPRQDLVIETNPIGIGQYGIIWEAVATGVMNTTEPVRVAIKSARQDGSTAHNDVLLNELRIMASIDRHPNVVSLLAVVKEDDLMLVLEYCQFGSLLRYLRSHKDDIPSSDADADGTFLTSSPEVNVECTGIEEPAVSQSEELTDNLSRILETTVLSTKDLTSFAFQVARAMEYLATRFIIHRDLAARNVLVDHNRIAKVADFGLAVQAHGEQSVTDTRKLALPIKWMAPESLTENTFSQRSDVWSFGVLIWELFSYGDVPYSNKEISSVSPRNLVDWIKSGRRLPGPRRTPQFMTAIMARCWEYEPGNRPTFNEIHESLQSFSNHEVTDCCQSIVMAG